MKKLVFNILFILSSWHWNLYFANKFLYHFTNPLIFFVSGYMWGINGRTLFFFNDRFYWEEPS